MLSHYLPNDLINEILQFAYIEEKYIEMCYCNNLQSIIKNFRNVNWKNGLYYSCKYGNKRLVALTIDKGAENFNAGFYASCKHGQIETAQMMIDKGVNSLTEGLYIACKREHIKIVKLILDLMSKNYVVKNWIKVFNMCYTNKKVDLMELLMQYLSEWWYLPNITELITESCVLNFNKDEVISLMIFLLKLDKINKEKIIKYVINFNDREILLAILEYCSGTTELGCILYNIVQKFPLSTNSLVSLPMEPMTCAFKNNDLNWITFKYSNKTYYMEIHRVCNNEPCKEISRYILEKYTEQCRSKIQKIKAEYKKL